MDFAKSKLGYTQFGVIYKGAVKQGNRPGKNLTTFRVEFKKDFKHLEPLFMHHYGADLSRFEEVRLLGGATPEKVFDPNMEEWAANGVLMHRCNKDTGVQSVCFNRNDGNYYQNQPCEQLRGGGCSCKPTGRLAVLFPKLGLMGYFLLTLHAINEIPQVQANINMIYSALGTLMGVPFLLERRDATISKPVVEKGKRTGERFLQGENLVFVEAMPYIQERYMLEVITHVVLPSGEVIYAGDVNPALVSGDQNLPALPRGTNDDETVIEEATEPPAEPQADSFPDGLQEGEPETHPEPTPHWIDIGTNYNDMLTSTAKWGIDVRGVAIALNLKWNGDQSIGLQDLIREQVTTNQKDTLAILFAKSDPATLTRTTGKPKK